MVEKQRLHPVTIYSESTGDGEGSDIHQRQFLLPARVFQMIGFHKRQAVAVEHEADVDEENPVAGAAVEEFLFEQFADAALIACGR